MDFIKEHLAQIGIAITASILVISCIVVGVTPKVDDIDQGTTFTESNQPVVPDPDQLNVSKVPVFVNNVDECTNRYQKYVLPDGLLYECKYNDWVAVEQYLPDYWMQEINETSMEIDNLNAIAGKDLSRFILTSDLHISNGKKYVKYVGEIVAHMMNASNSSYYIDLGDFCSQGTDVGVHNFDKAMDSALDYLEPIDTSKFLLAAGNHDGATGEKIVDGQTEYYCFQLTSTQRAETFYGWQKTNPNKIFGPDGTYYYIDDNASKTRYILLDSYWSGWAGSADGYVSNIDDNYFRTPFFGQVQLEWLATTALNLPDGYSAVIGTHDANEQKDLEILRGIVKAFKNKATYRGSYSGNKDWQTINISVDFSSSSGEIIAIFHGHSHVDDVDLEAFAVPYIGITSASGKDRPEGRVPDTVTETAIDVVTIDKNSRTIYLTRLGAGEDRTVNY